MTAHGSPRKLPGVPNRNTVIKGTLDFRSLRTLTLWPRPALSDFRWQLSLEGTQQQDSTATQLPSPCRHVQKGGASRCALGSPCKPRGEQALEAQRVCSNDNNTCPVSAAFHSPGRWIPPVIFVAAGRLFHTSLWSNPNNVHTSFQPGEARGHLLLIGALFANWSKQSPCLLSRASRSSCLSGYLRVQGVGQPVLVPGRGAVEGGQGP